MLCLPVSLVWLSQVMQPDTPVVELLLPIALMGVANGFMWAPLGTTATRNLPMSSAGAGAGVYNTTRQVGSVLGSASIAALMESRLAAHLPGAAGGPVGGALPPALKDGFSTAMAEAMLLPAAILVLGWLAVICFAAPTHLRPSLSEPVEEPEGRSVTRSPGPVRP